MTRHIGKDNVFLDVGSILFGVDFRTYLNDQIAAHDVVLVIIGPDWAQIMGERAGQQNDFVRIEIESALKQNKLVIPVLVKNATMPDFSQLPETVQDLQWRNSATVRRQPDLESDCTRLAEGIRQYAESVGLGTSSKTTSSTRSRSADILPAPFAWIEILSGHGTMKTDESNITLQIPTESYSIASTPTNPYLFAQRPGTPNPKPLFQMSSLAFGANCGPIRNSGSPQLNPDIRLFLLVFCRASWTFYAMPPEMDKVVLCRHLIKCA